MNEKYYCAVKALIFKDNKFLIIKRSLEAREDPYSWEFPGGALEFTESPEIALVREVKEETALEVECLFPISAWTFMKAENTQVIGITFLCILRKFNQVLLSKEHDEFAWINESEISEYKLSKDVAEEVSKWNWEFLKKLQSDYLSDKAKM
jgi:8-oxo-dGTP diphosphatase